MDLPSLEVKKGDYSWDMTSIHKKAKMVFVAMQVRKLLQYL